MGMLILSRKNGEAIQIGDDIEIVVKSISGDQVKIGINAPRNVEIHRKEIYLDIQAENTAATADIKDLLKKLTATKKNNRK